MNDLNSVLIEGFLTKEIYLSEKGDAVFPVASATFEKDKDGNYIRELAFFQVRVEGKLAESCKALGVPGRRLRAVGKLRQIKTDGTAHTYIDAEHVEFRPIDDSCKEAVASIQ